MAKVLKKRLDGRLSRTIITLLMIIIITVAISALLLESIMRPIFVTVASEQAIRLTTQMINSAVYEHAKTLKYTDLIYYQTNNQGDIILMQPNLQIVNEFVSQVNMSIQEKLKGLNEIDIQIPIAQVIGLQVLAGLGPKLNVQMVPIGLVKPPQIIDSFQAAGINQTRHKIYMEVSAEIQMVVPFIHKKLQINTQIPITEVTILGKVPEVYVGIDGGVLQKILENRR